MLSMDPPEEENSAGNNQLMEADSDRQDQNVLKNLKLYQFQGQQLQLLHTTKVNLFKKFKYKNVIKMKNKPDPVLLRSSYLFNEIKKAPKSRETISLKG
jgi:hypothetical protein